MTDNKLIKQIATLADKLVYAMDQGIEDNYAEEILQLCIESNEAREYWKQHFVEQACAVIDNLENDSKVGWGNYGCKRAK